jgi:outer membrane cobalamin receptor
MGFKKTLIVLATFVGIVFSGFSQQNSVFGRVVDEKTKLPIADVLIYWTTNKKEPVRTDENGTYKIDMLNEVEFENINALHFRSPGKKDKTVQFREIEFGECNIELSDSEEASSAGSRWNQPRDEIPASIVIITREEIEEQGYMTVQEVLENVPGMFVTEDRSIFDASIGVRGFWGVDNKSVMIQVNGVSMLTGIFNSFHLSEINVSVEAIDKIEIVRGPMSVNYGTGAVFGVINIITSAVTDGVSGSISGSYGTQDSHRLSGRYGVKTDDLNLSLNLMSYSRQGFKEQWKEMVSNSTFTDYDSLFGAGTSVNAYSPDDDINTDRYSKSYQGVNLAINYKNFFGHFNYAKSDFGFSAVHPGPNNRNAMISNRGVGQIGYNGELTNLRLKYNVTVKYSRLSLSPELQYLEPNSQSTNSWGSSSLRTELNANKELFRVKKKGLFKADLTVGLSHNRNLENYRRYSISESNIAHRYIGLKPGTHVDNLAGFAQTELIANYKKFGFQALAGGRVFKTLDYITQFQQNVGYDSLSFVSFFSESSFNSDRIRFVPRFALTSHYTVNNGSQHFLKLMYAHAYNRSTVFENAIQENPFGDSLSYSNLNPKLIKTLELNYTYVFKRHEFRFNLNGFMNNVGFLQGAGIHTSNSSTNYDASFQSLQSNGFEVIVDKAFKFSVNQAQKDSLEIEMSIGGTYQVSSNDSLEQDGHNVSFSPQTLGVGKLVARYKNLSLGVAVNYVGAMKSFTSNGVSEGSEDYARISLNLRIKNLAGILPILDDFYINAKVSNLLDKKYYYPTYVDNEWADQGFLGRGRQILFTVGYKF